MIKKSTICVWALFLLSCSSDLLKKNPEQPVPLAPVTTSSCSVTDYSCLSKQVLIYDSGGKTSLGVLSMGGDNISPSTKASSSQVPSVTQVTLKSQVRRLQTTASSNGGIGVQLAWKSPLGNQPSMCFRICPQTGGCLGGNAANTYQCVDGQKTTATSGTVSFVLGFSSSFSSSLSFNVEVLPIHAENLSSGAGRYQLIVGKTASLPVSNVQPKPLEEPPPTATGCSVDKTSFDCKPSGCDSSGTASLACVVKTVVEANGNKADAPISIGADTPTANQPTKCSPFPSTANELAPWSASVGLYVDSTDQVGRYVAGSSSVKDTLTGLYWEQPINATAKNWTSASAYCAALKKDSKCAGTWRLPTKIELQSLVDYTLHDPAINPVFTDTPSNGYFWASEPSEDNEGLYWGVDFEFGNSNAQSGDSDYYVRCVR